MAVVAGDDWSIGICVAVHLSLSLVVSVCVMVLWRLAGGWWAAAEQQKGPSHVHSDAVTPSVAARQVSQRPENRVKSDPMVSSAF